MMCDDGIEKVPCCDCGTQVTLVFTLAFSGTPHLVSLGRCTTCYGKGDKRSIRAKAKVEQVVWYEAVYTGLPVMEVRR